MLTTFIVSLVFSWRVLLQLGEGTPADKNAMKGLLVLGLATALTSGLILLVNCFWWVNP